MLSPALLVQGKRGKKKKDEIKWFQMLLSSSSLDFTLYLIFLHHHFELSVILYAPSLISFHVNLFYTIASDFLVEANRTHGDLINMRELPLLQSGLIWKKVWSTLISRSFLEQIFKGLCSQGFFIQGWESRSTGAASRYFTCYSGLEEPGLFEDVHLKMCWYLKATMEIHLHEWRFFELLPFIEMLFLMT